MNSYIKYGEAKEEARRLTKVHKRDVEAKHVDCECDYSRECYLCAGQGYYYEPVFADCDHKVGDGELIECHADGCLDRERSRADVTVLKAEHAPLNSCRDVAIEQAESEAAA